jgi:predicted metal-dependent hydrolase
MKESLLFFMLVISIYIFIYFNKNEVIYVESHFSGKEYLVQNTENKTTSADLLAKLESNMYKLRNYLVENKNLEKYKSNLKYIDLLEKNLNTDRTHIYEGTDEVGYTSYSVNKGEEIVFCLKSKETKEFHDINLILYVAIHEMAHIGCPEVGHTQLFKEIFAFFITEAIELNIYKYENYATNPVEYCGMTLSSSIT